MRYARGPYAWARFDLEKSYWETHFNDECYDNSSTKQHFH